MKFKSLIEVLTYWADKKPDEISCVFLEGRAGLEKQINYRQLDQAARSIAASLQHQGCQVGDRVLLMFVPGLELIKAFWGCLYAGAIAVPILPPTNKKLMEKTHRIIRNCTPKYLFMTNDTAQKFNVLFNDGEYLASSEHAEIIFYQDEFEDENKSWQKPSIDDQHIAFLQYTSGSTAYPKGVMVTHNNLLDNLEKIKNAFGMSSASRMFGWLPPYHDMGLIGNILSPIYAGYPTYLMTPFSFLQNPFVWLKYITQYKITISGCPNFAYDYCVKRIKEHKKADLDLSSWLVAFNGAEPVHHGAMERFYQAFRDYGFERQAFYPCYGLAEATLLVASGKVQQPYKLLHVSKEKFQDHHVEFLNQETENSYRLVSNGYCYHDIKIVNPDTKLLCNDDVVGEVWLQSDSVAIGYWQQSDETEQAFCSQIKNGETGKQYLRTGDLGFLHDNELYITGRIKDLIILYGKNHYPQDIENSLKHCDFHDQLGLSAAFVKSFNNEYRLTIVCEVRNFKMDPDESENLSVRIFDLIYQEHTLEAHKIVLVKRNSIPQTTSGKVKRSHCRDLLIDNQLPVIYTWQLKR